MVRLDKIYTKGGDKGLTSLGDGKRIKKNSLRVKAYGDVDELNSTLGVVTCFCSKPIRNILTVIQNDLFDLGADLCSTNEKKKTIFIY